MALVRQLVERACVGGGERLVLFAKRIDVLDLLQGMLETAHSRQRRRLVAAQRPWGGLWGGGGQAEAWLQQARALAGAVDSCMEDFGWRLDRAGAEGEVLRLEGATSSAERARLIKAFNHPNGRAKARLFASVFLLSTRAGSVGINLVSATRLVLMDVDWNPVHNEQAVSRIWRYGQTRPCFIYRLLHKATLEERIYDRTLAKEELFARAKQAWVTRWRAPRRRV
ncbi:Helicase ARIP4 [Monoraphidium neglectum]|uniref:Helicase ARIP4 n=1 Tax=Monoraphidium neglectum TaxID=145388 RepID=A0A0D2LJV1_9CHLO|nr:Helicase ARIP4 [Monoraphidium neglectum]KIY92254.1 Helicase ARIP4 [Monoraphidium neglectum]|eukprot:XP_013891274.1 Helicase ARIP4 [Monoraphidium neglectum]